MPAEGTETLAFGKQRNRSLEISHGRPRRAAWGAILGAVIGALPAYAGNQGCDDTDNPGQSVVGAGAGAALGALAGALVRGDERWEAVSLGRIRMGLEWQEGGDSAGAMVKVFS